MSGLSEQVEHVEAAAENAASDAVTALDHAAEAHGHAVNAHVIADAAEHAAQNAHTIAAQSAALAEMNAADAIAGFRDRTGALETWCRENEPLIAEMRNAIQLQSEKISSLEQSLSQMQLTPPQHSETEKIAAETSIAVTEALVKAEALEEVNPDAAEVDPVARERENAARRPRKRWL